MNIKDTLKEIDKLFKHINKRLYDNELPEPMLLIQNSGKRKNTLGWFTVDKIWSNKENGETRWEITICAEYLNRPIEEIFETLCHESVHMKNAIDNVVGVKARHHNKRFRDTCLAHGLDVKYGDAIYGWAFTSLNSDGLAVLNEIKGEIDPEAFGFSRMEEGEADKPKRERNHTVKHVCPSCGAKFRNKEKLNVRCEDCDELFEVEANEEGED